MPNRNEVSGKLGKAAGIVKEKVGRATGSRRLEEQGAADRTAGSVQDAFGKAGRKINEAIEDTKDDFRKP